MCHKNYQVIQVKSTFYLTLMFKSWIILLQSTQNEGHLQIVAESNSVMLQGMEG